MDYTGLAIIAGIIVYGIFEYQRREHQHNETMSYLNRGLKPPDPTPEPGGWKLGTVGILGIVALAMSILFANVAVQYGRVHPVALSIAFVFAGLFLLLVQMFVRDLRKYREIQRSNRKVKL